MSRPRPHLVPVDGAAEAWMPPHNVEAEMALLGAVLANNRVFERIAPFLRPEHFADEVHRRLFEAIADLIGRGDIANPITLKTHFEKDAGLSEIGGVQYLARLAAAVPSIANAENYGRLIHDLHLRRELLALAEEIGDRAQASDSGRGALEEVAEAINRLTALLAAAAPSRNTESRREVMTRVVESLKNPQRAFSTGLPNFDYVLGGGLYPEKSYGIAGRMKVGKTLIGGTISYNMNRAGVRHAWLALEMGSAQIEQRQMARDLGCSPSRFLGVRASIPHLVDAGRVAVTAPDNVVYADMPAARFDELKNTLAIMVVRERMAGFILDNLQLISGRPAKQTQADFIDEVCAWLSGFARRHRLFSIILVQTNQNGTTLGSEAPRRHFDWLGELHREQDSDTAWIDCLDSRYTGWRGVGTEDHPGLRLVRPSLYFEPAYEPPPGDGE